MNLKRYDKKSNAGFALADLMEKTSMLSSHSSVQTHMFGGTGRDGKKR